MDHVRMQIERKLAKERTRERRRIREEIAKIERDRSLLAVCLKSQWTKNTCNRLVTRVDFLRHREDDLIQELYSV